MEPVKVIEATMTHDAVERLMNGRFAMVHPVSEKAANDVTLLIGPRQKLYTQQEVDEARHVGHVAISTMALDMTEGIWPRVKGIEQHELIALAEKCIRKGIEMTRPKHGLITPTEDGKEQAKG